MLKNLVQNKYFTTNNKGIVYLQGLIYILKYIRSKIIIRYYKNLIIVI